MPVSPMVIVWFVPKMPWSWTGVAWFTVSPLWTTQRARSFITYGWTKRSMYMTPGTRASFSITLFESSARTPPV